MDVRIEAVAMTSTSSSISAEIKTNRLVSVSPVVSNIATVSIFRPISVNGHSISAVAPDNNILGGVAVAA